MPLGRSARVTSATGELAGGAARASAARDLCLAPGRAEELPGAGRCGRLFGDLLVFATGSA